MMLLTYSSGRQPGVRVPPAISEDILGVREITKNVS
jgi:hypothetical protein